MPRSLQRNVLVAGGVVVLLALVVLTAPRLVRLDRYRSRLEAAASAVLGMDVRVGGRLGLRLLPGVRVTLEDGSWVLARASSNKPELVVVVESMKSEDDMRALFREEIKPRLGKFPEVGAYNQEI